MAALRSVRWPPRATAAVLIGLLFWSIVTALTSVALIRERGQVLRQAEQNAAALTSVMEENTERIFQTVDVALEAVARTIVQGPPPRHDPATRELMRAQLKHLPTVRALFVVGRGGFIDHDTDYPRTPDVSLADRDYFKAHARDLSLEKSLSAPLQSRSRQGWFLAATQHIGDAGDFRGIVVAAVQLDYIGELYKRLELGKGYVIGLYHRDGRLLARYPPEDASIGRSFAGLPLFTDRLPSSSSGTSLSSGPPLDYERVFSYRALRNHDLVVTLSHDKREIVAAWNRTAVGAAIALLFLLALTLAGVYQYVQKQRQLDVARHNARLADQALALAQANAKFRTFFEQGRFFSCVMALDGSVLEANQFGMQACGLTREAVIGQRLWDCAWWSPAQAAEIRAGFAAAVAGLVHRAETAFNLAGAAASTVELVLSPVRDEAGKVLFVAAQGVDVGERKRHEQELRRLADELSLSDRLKGEFLTTLSHELRNVLAPLRNGLALLERGADRPEVVSKARAMMRRQLDHMGRLLDDMLDLARVGSGKLELQRRRVDLRQVLSGTLDASEPMFKSAAQTLSWVLPEEPLWVHADTTRLAQVFANLLNNAAKYTPRGGHIRLEARAEQGQGVVEVIDDGLGIPAEALDSVFTMFEQVPVHRDHAQGGLGIGLSLVRQLVELHGGSVGVSSAGSGLGSTFTVRLPLLASADPPDEPPVPAASEGPLASA